MVADRSDRQVGQSLEEMVEFVSNPEQRCACVLLLDTSYSMDGAPLDALNAGVSEFRDALTEDELASLRVETAIVTFDTEVKLVQKFATAHNFTPPTLTTGGVTSMAKGVDFALDMVEERKRAYRDAKVSYYRPWILMITDGASTDSRAEMDTVSAKVHKAESNKAVAFFCVGVDGADMDELNRLAPRGAVPLDGLAFRELFLWLSESLTRVSSSRKAEEIELADLSGWAKI